MPITFHLSAPVRAALESHTPVVALESTLITHGLPRPVKHQLAHSLEAAVHSNNVLSTRLAQTIQRLQVT
jgi:pseudouridine-5'-phosphate glycosidase